MREITDLVKDITDKQLEEKYGNQPIEITIAGQKVYFSKRLYRFYEKKLHYYTLDDLRDLHGHYDFLSQTAFFPLTFIPVALSIGFKLHKQNPLVFHQPANDAVLYDELTEEGSSRKMFRMSKHHCTLDNMYLDNFSFIHRQSFDACTLTVTDGTAEKIDGVFVYRHFPKIDKWDDQLKTQLTSVLAAEAATPFDILFTPMHPNYPVQKHGEIQPRGKKLLIQYIQWKKEEPESAKIPSIYSTHPPVLIGV